MENLNYSVIMPFFNEEKTLETAVLNLLKEDLPARLFCQ